MRTYELKDCLPSWHFEPAANRQLKVLRFFGVAVDGPVTKGRASGTIGGLFKDPQNRHLWNAYVYTTGDTDDASSELQPHDRSSLAQISIPDDWHPKPTSGTRTANRKALLDSLSDLLREGSPFDEPLPVFSVDGTCFCFTGKFTFGSRNECQQAVTSAGGSCSDNVTSKTDVLVIGSDASSSWAHGSYGHKIEAAMVRRMQSGRPVIIPEAYWKKLLPI
ncbi:hypothetical protein HQ590_04390 [bacterium]|nr:hypothetical protein [bacterium]